MTQEMMRSLSRLSFKLRTRDMLYSLVRYSLSDRDMMETLNIYSLNLHHTINKINNNHVTINIKRHKNIYHINRVYFTLSELIYWIHNFINVMALRILHRGVKKL